MGNLSNRIKFTLCTCFSFKYEEEIIEYLNIDKIQYITERDNKNALPAGAYSGRGGNCCVTPLTRISRQVPPHPPKNLKKRERKLKRWSKWVKRGGKRGKWA